MYLNKQVQHGFLVPLALFILVGLSVLAISMSRVTGSSYSSAVFEALSVQSFYAAESGAHYAMNQLVFDVTDQAVADTNCTNLAGASLNFNVSGLSNCSATFNCAMSTVSGSTAHFYTISSVGVCGSGELSTERTIEVTAVME